MCVRERERETSARRERERERERASEREGGIDRCGAAPLKEETALVSVPSTPASCSTRVGRDVDARHRPRYDGLSGDRIEGDFMQMRIPGE